MQNAHPRRSPWATPPLDSPTRGRKRGLFAAVAAAVALVAVGCGGTVSEPDTAPAEHAQAAEGHGPIAAVKRALAKVELDEAQRAKTDRAISAVETKLEPVHAARMALVKDVAAGVRAGRIDRAKVDARTKEISDGITAAVPTIESSLATLHATLDADQREALIDALRDGFRGAKGKRGEELRAIADELGLSAEQRDAIKEAMKAEMRGGERGDHGKRKARFAELRERARAAADAFRSDQFDPKSLEIGEHAPKAAQRFSEGMVKMIETALMHLTPEQRNKLADILERKAAEL